MRQAPRAAWVVAACLACAVPARALEIISVEAGPTSERGLYSMDAKVVLDARPTAMRHVLVNLCDHREQMENLAYCRIFKVQGNRSWSYAMVELPVLDPRDYVIASTVERELAADGTGTYRSCWDLSPTEGPGPRRGVVRLPVNRGCWTMTPVGGGQKTHVHYALELAPGGVVPGWAAGYVARKTLPDYMRLLERLGRAAEAKGVPPHDPLNPWAGASVSPLDRVLPAPRTPLPMPGN